MRSPILIASLSAALTWFGVSAVAQPAAPASAAVETGKAAAAPAGLSAERLKRLDSLLQKYVDDNRVAGVVALVLRDGSPVYQRAVGWSDKEAGQK